MVKIVVKNSSQIFYNKCQCECKNQGKNEREKGNTGNPVKCAFEKGKCLGSIINDLVIFVEIIQ